jgi:hypothetical protein
MVWSALAHLFTVLVALMNSRRRSAQDKDLEILILQHQLNLLVRKQKNPIQATRAEKLTLAVLAAMLKARTGRSARTMAHLVRLYLAATGLLWRMPSALIDFSIRQPTDFPLSFNCGLGQ